MKLIQFILLALPFLAFGQAQKGVQPINQSTAQPTGQTRAVVIGISDYQEKDIPDLRFADKDALAFANYLRSPAGGSLDNDHLQVLTNQNATAGRVAEALDALVEQTKEGDQVIIYFSGHGDVERKTISQPGFLLCWDSPARVYMGGGTYSLAFLQEIVSTLSTQNRAKVLVVTDACHAGKLAGSQIGGSQATVANLAKQFANEVKILSCQPNEFSLEGEQWGGGRGVFSYHLVDGLAGLADRNGDGTVSVGEIDRYLEDHVTAEAAPQSQVPMLLGNKTERLATVNPAILAALQKSKASGLPVFGATEGKGFEEEILEKADSSVRQQYFAFKKAVREKRFFRETENAGRVSNPSDVGPTADELYAQLAENEALAPLRGMMKRNYAAALQDDAQQVMNTMLKSGLTSEILTVKKAAKLYANYPAYLDRAAELLGSSHYMYRPLKARKAFFEGKIQSTRRESRKKYLEALQIQPDLPHAYAELITTYGAAQADSANYYAARAMEIAPTWTLPYFHLARFNFFMQKNPATCMEVLDKALQLDSNAMLILYEKGTMAFRMGDFATAEPLLKKVINQATEGICFPCAHNNLGAVFGNTGRVDDAIAEFRKSLAIDSAFIHTYLNIGVMLYMASRPAEAVPMFQKMVELDSTMTQGLTYLGDAYSATKRYDAAEAVLKKSLNLDSTQAEAYLGLAEVCLSTERLAEAEAMVAKALSFDSTLSNAQVIRGRIYLKKNRVDDAERAFQAELAQDPESINARVGLAAACTRQAKPDEAMRHLDDACKKGFHDFDFLVNDPDLAPLRTLPEWKALMKKNFPDKVKD